MLDIIFFMICFGASTVGAICGIGGGVIIKPVLDAFGVMSVSTISFLSGLTVLCMSSYSVIRMKLEKSSAVKRQTGLPLAIGAALGGVAGKALFGVIKASFPDPEKVGTVQAVCLAAVTAATLFYTLKKEKISTKSITSPVLSAVLGALLGIMSSFLGIGGGPINLVVLAYFFSMSSKVAAANSLYVIFFSQVASLLYSVFTKSIPQFSILTLVVMAAGGIAGGIVGRKINKTIDDKVVDKLFICCMVVIIMICIFNAVK